MNTTKPSGGADTPYQRAGQVWDERLGTARAQVTRAEYQAFLDATAGSREYKSGSAEDVPVIVPDEERATVSEEDRPER